MTPTEARVIKIIRDKADEFDNRHARTINRMDDAQLLEAMARPDLHFDSLDMVEHVMACEEVFGIEISDDEADLAADSTVRQWAAFIEARLTAKAVLGSVAA
jgi:acyl carrier protein